MTTHSSKPHAQVTITLAEIEQLKSENAALKAQVAQLQKENEALKRQLESLHSSRPGPKVNLGPRRGGR